MVFRRFIDENVRQADVVARIEGEIVGKFSLAVVEEPTPWIPRNKDYQ
jgi:hypothetical protein